MQLDVVATRELSANRRQHRRGSTGVDGGAVGAVAEQLRRRRNTARIVGADFDAVTELRYFVEERQAVATATGIGHRPLDAEAVDVADHRQDRCDADAGGDEPQTPRGRSVAGHGQREGVARSVRGDPTADA